jgi:hypothetical protein
MSEVSIKSLQAGKKSASGRMDGAMAKGTGDSKGSSKGGTETQKIGKEFHERPASEKGTEFSVLRNSGTGLSK